MNEHTKLELKRAGLVEGATITPEVVAAVAQVMATRDKQAQKFADGDMIGGVRICTTAHHQLNERIDELNAIRAEMDKPGYPQAG